MAVGEEIAHLESLREDLRDEIKRRNEDRERYQIEIITLFGTIIAVSFLDEGPHLLLAAIPAVSLYFNFSIQSSYLSHRLLTRHLRDTIEPALAARLGTDPSWEWETYYVQQLGVARVGIRRAFFFLIRNGTTAGALAYLFATEPDAGIRTFVGVVAAVYVMVEAYMHYTFAEAAERR